MQIAAPAPARAVASSLGVRRLAVAAPAATVALAFLIRGRRIFMLSDFPLNDGGMFYAAIEQLRRTHDALPAVLDYNFERIPFAYPPLAFSVTALASDALRIDTVDALRIFPLLFATLMVVAYVPLARALAPNALAAAVAVFVFATQPSAFTWMVMGGGLTRALGIALGTATLVALHRLLARGGRGAIAVTAVLAALTVLTHIEIAWFVSFSGLIFWWSYADDRRRALRRLLVAGVAALALSAPWWATVVVRWGVGPFVNAATTGSLGNPVTDLLAFQRTDEPFFPLVAALGLLGVLASLLRRRYTIPLWLVATALLDARSFNTLSALPLGLLAGVAVTDLIVPFARDRRALALAAVFGVTYATVGAFMADEDLHRGLTPPERTAMAWVAANTPADAQVLVVTDRFWAGDRVAEWFPALAQRRSVTTVQGTEWLPKERGFWPTMERYEDAQRCATRDGACVLAWEAQYEPVDYVFLPKTRVGESTEEAPVWCCSGLRAALRTDPAFRLVYDGPGATIFARR